MNLIIFIGLGHFRGALLVWLSILFLAFYSIEEKGDIPKICLDIHGLHHNGPNHWLTPFSIINSDPILYQICFLFLLGVCEQPRFVSSPTSKPI